jgi:hypothetical protein
MDASSQLLDQSVFWQVKGSLQFVQHPDNSSDDVH